MKLRITVQGQAYDVDVEVLDEPTGPAARIPSVVPAVVATPARAMPTEAPKPAVNAAVTGDRVVKAPIVGTITQVKVAPGEVVELHQVLLVMEAMKMETNVASPLAGKVRLVLVSSGDAVKSGQVLVEME